MDVDDLAGPVGDEKERVDRADPGVVELQDIAGPDVVRVVPEEGPQVWPCCPRGRTDRMYCWTVRLLTRMPSLSSSPRIRSALRARW